jgi:adenylate cyclase
MAKSSSKARLTGARRTFIIGVIIVGVLLTIDLFHPALLEFADLKVFDLRLDARVRPPQTGKVAIITIDDSSIAQLGQWPWPRNVMGRLVHSLGDYKVAVIGMDLIFSEADAQDLQREAIAGRLKGTGLSDRSISDTLGPSNDEAFAHAMAEEGGVYIGYTFEAHRMGTRARRISGLSGFRTELLKPWPVAYGIVREGPGPLPRLLTARAYLPPVPALNAAARGAGFVDADADMDGVFRSELTVVRFQGHYCVPLYLAVASAYLHQPLSLAVDKYGVERVALGNIVIPVDEMGRMLVNFRGPEGTFAQYSAADVIAHRVPSRALDGKIVLVGLTAHGLGDRLVTPAGSYYPGVAVHANSIDNILRGDFLRRSESAEVAVVFVTLILGIVASLAAAFLSAVPALGASVVLGGGYFLYAQHRLASDGLVLGVVLPEMTLAVTYTALVFYRFLTEGREKRRLRRAWEHYLHPEVISSIIDNPSGLKLGGERRHLSVLFADIRGFTSRSERSEPEALVALLNTYLTVMTDLILKSGGVVDKLMGDGIMAFWGAPAAMENPARSAIDCALRMLEELNELKKHDPRFADVNIGIGISTGDPIVGNFGGERRFDYSAIGDTVNFASRLEGLTGHFKVPLLVSRQTFEEANNSYVAREIGLVKVKGKEQLVPIVEVVGATGDGIDPTFYGRFDDALALIRKGASGAASETLKELLKLKPDDEVVSLYLEKLQSASEPPTEIIFEFETK